MDVEFDVGGTMSPVSEPHDLAATSLFYVFGLAALALLSLGLLVWTSLEQPYTNGNGTFIAVAVFWVGFSTSAWGIYRTCYRVEVSDGYLVMRYLYRRRVVRLEKVRRIEFIEPDEDSSSPAKFEVSLADGSSFRVTANRSTRPLMEAIVRGQPDILVIGQISPPTKPPTRTKPPPMSKLPPRTQEDNEFWSGRGRD